MEVAASSGRLTGLLCSPAGLLGGAAGPLGGVGLLEAVVEEVASGSRHFGLLLGGTAGLLGGAGHFRGGVNRKRDGGGEKLTGGD